MNKKKISEVTLIGNCWVDNNNNRWAANITKEQANEYSVSLTGCSDCVDCTSCSGCTSCSDCLGCTNCTDCSDCVDCSNCLRCSACKSQPEIYTTIKMGPRYDITVFYRVDAKVFVSCDCYRGTLAEFAAWVQKTYPDRRNKHWIQYSNEIKKVKKLWGDKQMKRKILNWMATYITTTMLTAVVMVIFAWGTSSDCWTAGTSQWTGPIDKSLHVCNIIVIAMLYSLVYTPIVMLMSRRDGNA